MYDYFDHKVHECGCETRFNCILWTSETLHQCDDHRRIVEASAAYSDDVRADQADECPPLGIVRP